METNKKPSTKPANATTKSDAAKHGAESKTIKSTANAKTVGGEKANTAKKK